MVEYVNFEQGYNSITICRPEEIKDMSPAEEVEYFRRETEETIKKYGLRLVKSAQETVAST
jgi:hypothetical protein